MVEIRFGENYETVGLAGRSVAEVRREYEVAFDAYVWACTINRAAHGYCYGAARMAFELGDWENAIHYYQLGFYPSYVEDWAKMIRAAQLLGREEDARAYLEQAQMKNPADYETLLQGLP